MLMNLIFLCIRNVCIQKCQQVINVEATEMRYSINLKFPEIKFRTKVNRNVHAGGKEGTSIISI